MKAACFWAIGFLLPAVSAMAADGVADIFARTCFSHLADFTKVDGAQYEPFIHSAADPYIEPGVPFLGPSGSEFWMVHGDRAKPGSGFVLQVVHGKLRGETASGCAVFGKNAPVDMPTEVLPSFDKIRYLGETKGRMTPVYRHWLVAAQGRIVILNAGWDEDSGNLYLSLLAPDVAAIESLSDDIVKGRAGTPPIPGVD